MKLFFVANFFVGFLLEMTSQIFTVKGRGSQAPSPRCKKSRTPISNLCLFFCVFYVYIDKIGTDTTLKISVIF